MKPFLLSIFLLAALGGNAQNNIFEWDEGLTYYTGTFDPSVYSREEVKAIYDLLVMPTEYYTIGDIWKIEQMDTATTKPVDLYHARTLHTLNTMKLPVGVFWDSLKSLRIRELNEVTEFKRKFLRGLHQPSVLLAGGNPSCDDHAKALNGTEADLLKAWHELKEIQKARNISPKEVERRYQQELQSKDKLKYARLELMTYAWWNCHNQYIYRVNDDVRIEAEFEKIFVKVDVVEEED